MASNSGPVPIVINIASGAAVPMRLSGGGRGSFVVGAPCGAMGCGGTSSTCHAHNDTAAQGGANTCSGSVNGPGGEGQEPLLDEACSGGHLCAMRSGRDNGARRLVLGLLFLANLVVFTLVQLLAPFFPQLARDNYGATPFLTGVIFATAPLAQVLSCPVWSICCQRLGRMRVLLLGLLLVSSGCALFGLADSMVTFAGARAIQGMGGAAILVAGMAIIMDCSLDVEGDVARQEIAAGSGAMLGPALGGVLSTYLGVRTLFLSAALVPVIIALVLLGVLRCSALGRALGAYGGRREGTGAGGLNRQATRLRLRDVLNGSTMWCAFAIFASSCAMNFWDPIMAQHLSSTLGTDAARTGGVLSVASVTYIFCCYLLVPRVCDRLGNKPTIVLGSLLNGLAYIGLGPAPVLTAFSDLSLVSRPVAWALTLFSLAAAGVAESLIIVPAAPLMLASVQHLRDQGLDPSDPLAAIFQQCWSAGEFFGPMLGGVLAQLLPMTHEMACRGDDCLSTFPWTSCIFGLLGLGVMFGFAVFVPADPGEKEGDKGKREEGTRRRRRRRRKNRSRQWGEMTEGSEGSEDLTVGLLEDGLGWSGSEHSSGGEEEGREGQEEKREEWAGHSPLPPRGHSPILRGHSPILRGHSPILRGHSPVRREHSPVSTSTSVSTASSSSGSTASSRGHSPVSVSSAGSASSPPRAQWSRSPRGHREQRAREREREASPEEEEDDPAAAV